MIKALEKKPLAVMKSKRIYLKIGFAILSAIGLAWFLAAQCFAASQKVDLPLPARIVLSKAAKAMNQKDYDQAIELLSAFQARGKDLKPKSPDPRGFHHAEVYFALGTCQLLKGNYQQAAAAFVQTLKKNPNHVAGWLNLAQTRYGLNEYLSAANCFIKAYDNSAEKNPEHLYYGAAAYLVAQKNKASIAAFERLLKNHPEAIRPVWRETYIQALLADGHPRRALPHIKHLAKQYSGEKQIQWQEILLQQYMQLNMDKQARTYVRFLNRQAPTLAKWWKALVHIDLQEGDDQGALTALIIYGFLTPLSDRETKLLADLHLQLGIPFKAAPLYESALQKKDDVGLLNNLVLALRQLGQPQKALEALERFAPQNKAADLLMLKADLLYGMKRYKLAYLTCRSVTQADTSQSAQKGRAWLMAGYAALQANDLAASRSALEQAATFKKQRKAALAALRQLSETKPASTK